MDFTYGLFCINITRISFFQIKLDLNIFITFIHSVCMCINLHMDMDVNDSMEELVHSIYCVSLRIELR